ncbi:TrkH family potassium uptake protein [Luteimonas aestuarii]|uniref:TrkH family potassium uptake protein n=1 Tax=Luteimonas aestuarii TaxID=453837 RepID=A0A4R5TIQ1_9GAMM|nr:potassium transporter TrkG [Luteimonas aestuarii]TDK20502.1 TrkH family potassium uptake protein [Luteimonas aestuarii]
MQQGIRHPARLLPIGFLIVIVIGTGLLMLPGATMGEGSAPLLTALFTSTSAVCVTGLVVVDTPTYWSGFGQVVIMGLFQVGGFGIMAGATLMGLLVAGRLNLNTRVAAQHDTRLGLGSVGGVVKIVLLTTLIVESIVWLALTLRLRFGYGMGWGEASWHGAFQSVSAFNNAGFSTWSDSLMGFAHDPWVLFAITFAVVLGGLGFPVVYELRHKLFNYRRWSVHTKITLLGSALLVVAGGAVLALYEWNNPATLGGMPTWEKWLSVVFGAVSARTAGFNTIATGAMTLESQAATWAMMFIGGGSAGTAGGIKLTTFFLLGFAVWSEIRNEPDTIAFGRRIPSQTLRLALTVVLLAMALLAVGTLALMSVTDFPLEDVMFEAISATATVGLSTGITSQLPPAGQCIIIILMFIGRVGTVTVATGLALRATRRLYRYPEERPIVG